MIILNYSGFCLSPWSERCCNISWWLILIPSLSYALSLSLSGWVERCIGEFWGLWFMEPVEPGKRTTVARRRPICGGLEARARDSDLCWTQSQSALGRVQLLRSQTPHGHKREGNREREGEKEMALCVVLYLCLRMERSGMWEGHEPNTLSGVKWSEAEKSLRGRERGIKKYKEGAEQGREKGVRWRYG